MSASSDQYPDGGLVAPPPPPPGHAPLSAKGGGGGGRSAPPPPGGPSARPNGGGAAELVAPAREEAVTTQKGNAPIVPAGSVTGRSLTLVIAIMCFLACLTAGAVYMINQSAAAWLRNIASEVTVQVEVADLESAAAEKRVSEVVFFLARQAGVQRVRPFSTEETSDLLEPWLGSGAGLDALPVPRLIALELDRQAPPDLLRLQESLAIEFPQATLDDHRQWQQQIRTVTRSLALGGLAILVLVGAATTAIIISATRSSMASNREIVEVLHFVGATDRFIAHEFEKHFLTLGIRAGIVGAGAAMMVFFVMPGVIGLLGGGTVTMSEIRRLIGTGVLDLAGYFLLGIVVVVIAALCMLTSRYGVFRILNSRS